MKLKKERARRARRLKRIDEPYLRHYLERLGNLSREASVPVVVVLLDIAVVRSRFLEKALRENQLYFLNSTLAFKGRPYGDYIINPLDSHPNGAANKIFAGEIYAYLRETNLLADRDQAVAAEAGG